MKNYRKILLNHRSIKLNCAPVTNLSKTSEPIPVNNKEFRHKLAMDRQKPDDYEIYRVEKVFSIDSRGQQRELVLIFRLHSPKMSKINTVGSPNLRKVIIARTKATMFGFLFLMQIETCPTSKTILPKRFVVIILFVNQCCRQEFALIGSGPLNFIKSPVGPPGTSACEKSVNGNTLIYLFITSHYRTQYQRFFEEALDLYVNQEDLVGQRQIESIEQLDAEEGVAPSKIGGWRGYYRGTKYTLVLNERKFEVVLPFGSVLNQYLALFSHINSFSWNLLGNERVFKWQPMTDTKY